MTDRVILRLTPIGARPPMPRARIPRTPVEPRPTHQRRPRARPSRTSPMPYDDHREAREANP